MLDRWSNWALDPGPESPWGDTDPAEPAWRTRARLRVSQRVLAMLANSARAQLRRARSRQARTPPPPPHPTDEGTDRGACDQHLKGGLATWF